MEKWKHSHFSSQQIECEIPIRKCDDFWTIKLAVFVVSLNSEGKSMRSDQYLKSSGWTRSLSTLFASFHFIHSQLFVGSFQIRFRWNIFVSGCSFSYIQKMQTTKRFMGSWFLEEKNIIFHWCYLSSLKLNQTSVLKLGEVWTQKF